MNRELDFCREAKGRLMALEAEQVELYRRFEALELECYHRLGIQRSMASRTRPLKKRRLRLSNILDETLNGIGRIKPS